MSALLQRERSVSHRNHRIKHNITLEPSCKYPAADVFIALHRPYLESRLQMSAIFNLICLQSLVDLSWSPLSASKLQCLPQDCSRRMHCSVVMLSKSFFSIVCNGTSTKITSNTFQLLIPVQFFSLNLRYFGNRQRKTRVQT